MREAHTAMLEFRLGKTLIPMERLGQVTITVMRDDCEVVLPLTTNPQVLAPFQMLVRMEMHRETWPPNMNGRLLPNSFQSGPILPTGGTITVQWPEHEGFLFAPPPPPPRERLGRRLIDLEAP